MILSSINAISCPKTEVPKKCVPLPIVICFVVKTKLQKSGELFAPLIFFIGQH
jgi:hypothetical protein